MQIFITDKDYEKALGEDYVKSEIKSDGGILLGPDDDKIDKVINLLPKVLASKIRSMIPDEFKIMEISIKVKIGGKPFGIGIEGDATVKFGPLI